MSAFVREQGRWRLLAQSSTPIRGFIRDEPQPAVDQAQSVAAPSEDLVAIEWEVLEALEAEQRAFVTGDCVMARFFSDDPFLFVVGGRAIQIEGAPAGGRTCERRAANPDRRPRTTERHDVHVLGPNEAYTVTHYANQVTRPDGAIATYPSVVTKIWARQGDTWRIVHFHESEGQPPSLRSRWETK
jgi:ketosteroid isomerase-like protein